MALFLLGYLETLECSGTCDEGDKSSLTSLSHYVPIAAILRPRSRGIEEIFNLYPCFVEAVKAGRIYCPGQLAALGSLAPYGELFKPQLMLYIPTIVRSYTDFTANSNFIDPPI